MYLRVGGSTGITEPSNRGRTTLNGGDVKAMRVHMDGQTGCTWTGYAGVYGRADGVRSRAPIVLYMEYAERYIYVRARVYIYGHVESIEDRQEGVGARFF